MTPYWIASVVTGVISFYVPGKYKKIFNTCTFVLLALVMSCNNFSPDEVNMYNNYNSNSRRADPSSWLFYLCAWIARRLGITFGWFNFITITITLILIVNTVSIYTPSWGFVLGLYSLSAACLDATLYRQFVASGFIVFGFRYLLDQKKSVKRYILFVLIASGFHLAMISYVIFAIIGHKNKSKMYKWIRIMLPCLIFATVCMTLANNRVVPGLDLLNKLFGNNKLNSYIDKASGNWGWLYPVLIVIATWIMLYLYKQLAYKMPSQEGIRSFNLMKIANEINLISIVYIPFCIMYMVSFSRLYRPLVWIYLIITVLFVDKIPKGKINLKILAGGMIYIGTFCLIFNYIIFSYDLVIKEILNGRMFWR